MISKTAVQLIDSKSRKTQFSSSTKVRIIGFFPDTKNEGYRIFENLAKFYSNEIIFGLVQDAKYAKSFKLKDAGEVSLLKPNDRPLVFKINKNPDEFAKWIEDNKKPLWEELTYSNVHSMWQGTPNFMIFMNSPESESTKKVLSVFSNLAKEYGKNYKNQINFVAVNGDLFQDFVNSLNLKSEDLPTFVIINPNDQAEYMYPKTQSLTLPNAKKWLDSYLADKLIPTERDLYNNNDHVTKIDSESWDFVLDKTKDVLVEFYGSNCRLCQLIAPHFKQLALIFGEHPGFALSVFDTSKSTPPASISEKITDVPTLLFFPSKNKSPIVFQEQVGDLESLFRFTMQHQTTLSTEEATDLITRANQYFLDLKAARATQTINPETDVEEEESD